MDKLTEIMIHKRREIAPLLRPLFADELQAVNRRLPRPPSFLSALRRPDGKLAVISEIKRRSPSAGAINEQASAVEQARRYRAAGAAALSILTDTEFFGGHLADLVEVTTDFARIPPAAGVTRSDPIPCLRKDFMVHPIQVLQAREAGASAILIIVRALTDEEIAALRTAAAAAGLDALFEIHNEEEIRRAVQHQAKIIGVNNRDLATFKTDIGLSERLMPLFPKDVVAISESGFSSSADAARARAAGAHALLVGESLMKAADPAALIADFQRV
jgi:indole-3-glycerol phosphate synthase